MKTEFWPVLWEVLKRNFCLDESVFQAGDPEPLLFAAKRDGQRDVMLFIRNIINQPTPSVDEEAIE